MPIKSINPLQFIGFTYYPIFFFEYKTNANIEKK